MNLNLEKLQKLIFFIALFSLMPLWNIPHTIALRYVCEGILLIILFYYGPNWKSFFNKNKILLVFFAYLIFQLLFFSSDYKVALLNFKGEWMHFILFSIIGAGIGLVLGKKIHLNFLLFCGVAFSIPLYIHLILFLFKGVSTGIIPWKYTGINETHGALAYASLQASIFLLTYFLFEKNSLLKKVIAGVLLIPCISSVLLAASRGGIGFFIITMVFITLIYFFFGDGRKISFKFKFILLASLLLMTTSIFQIGAMTDPARWTGIKSRILLGLEANPAEIYCKGITSLEKKLNSEGISITPEIKESLDSIVNGDGARIMAAKFGLLLTTQFPMGINQSRQAYEQSIIQICKETPALLISHSHNAWIDTALAIGIPGAILLALVFFNYARLGFQSLKLDSPNSPFGMALLASTVLWLLRGILDSTLRDQMLEIQAFTFALLLGIIVSRTASNKKTNAPLSN